MDWWRGAVLYQIYPRSFFDRNGDGIGDLPGITGRLDYIAELGVDGIWLSPFFRSPMADFGYDVSDYRDVDPIFGTLADFDELLEQAHRRGLKVVIDQVYSHTSDRHAWFQESRRDRANPKADWYVWADPKADGTPPNNWLAFFGGPAWTWDTQRRQYYMHNFLPEQPDLNFHNPEVREALWAVARFWLDRGVDGFRLDVVNYYLHDAKLRDNPTSGRTDGLRPYDFQDHRYERSLPENLECVRELRNVVDAYPERMTVGEIGSSSFFERCIQYTEAPTGLHTAYSFYFLSNPSVSGELVRSAFRQWTSETAWPSWSFSNHDVPRVLSRWGTEPSPGLAKILVALLVSLRGTAFLYQGEELGLPQADVPFDELQDPEGIRFWPNNLGRDGCRTPIPWRAEEPYAGFSTTKPWLPVDPRHVALAVDAQEQDPESTLQFVRRFLAFRKLHPSLISGSIRFVDAPEPLVVFSRTEGEETLLLAFNLGERRVSYDLPDGYRPRELLASGLGGTLEGSVLALPPFNGAVGRI